MTPHSSQRLHTSSPMARSTSARGFRAGAVAAGIKAVGQARPGHLVSDVRVRRRRARSPSNAFPGRARRAQPRARGGTAARRRSSSTRATPTRAPASRACADAHEMARLAAEHLGIAPDAGAGRLDRRDRRAAADGPASAPACRSVQLRADGGHAAAQRDHDHRHAARRRPRSRSSSAAARCASAAMAKGVGHDPPEHGHDAGVRRHGCRARPALRQRGAASARSIDTFNMITVDGDTSTNDSCFLLANGAVRCAAGRRQRGRRAVRGGAGSRVHRPRARDGRDGEGATKLLQVDVTGAAQRRRTHAPRRARGRRLQPGQVRAVRRGSELGPHLRRGWQLGRAGRSGRAPRCGSATVQVARDGVATGVSKDAARAADARRRGAASASIWAWAAARRAPGAAT